MEFYKKLSPLHLDKSVDPPVPAELLYVRIPQGEKDVVDRPATALEAAEYEAQLARAKALAEKAAAKAEPESK